MWSNYFSPKVIFYVLWTCFGDIFVDKRSQWIDLKRPRETWHSGDILAMNMTGLFPFFSSLFYDNKLNSQLWLKLRIGLEKVHYFYSQAVFQIVAPRDAEILKQL